MIWLNFEQNCQRYSSHFELLVWNCLKYFISLIQWLHQYRSCSVWYFSFVRVWEQDPTLLTLFRGVFLFVIVPEFLLKVFYFFWGWTSWKTFEWWWFPSGRGNSTLTMALRWGWSGFYVGHRRFIFWCWWQHGRDWTFSNWFLNLLKLSSLFIIVWILFIFFASINFIR